MRQSVRRWGVGLLGGLGLLGLGLLYADAALVAAALIPLSYVLYGAVSSVPEDTTVAVERSVRPRTPEPGEPVQVSLRVTNEGEDVLSDIRVIDGVPEPLAVTDGAARLATSLAPGESASTRYTTVAKRGAFAFDPPAVRVRSLADSVWETSAVSVAGDTGFTCATVADTAPLSDQTVRRQGTVATDKGGPGLEFYSTRQYLRGDPVNRIDWHHVAKTGEFITVQYRTEQSVRAVVVVDARPPSNVTGAAGYPTGTALSAYAGERLFEALGRTGVETSATAVGFEAGELGGLVGPDGLPWIDPEHDSGTRGQADLLFGRLQTASDRPAGPLSLELPPSVRGVGPGAATGGPDGGGTAGDEQTTARADGSGQADADATGGDEQIERLLARLGPDTQVVLCSPLLDGWPVRLANTLSLHGYPLVVVSPNVTNTGSPGQRLAGVSRRARLRALDRMGADTVDWQVTDSVGYAVRSALPHVVSDQ